MTINATDFKVLDLKKVIERANELLCCLDILEKHTEFGIELAQARVNGLDIVARHEPMDMWEKLAWQMVLTELQERFTREQDDSIEKRPKGFNGGLV